MYLSAEAILELEKKYGSPVEVSFAYEMTEREFDMVRASQKHGRAHDVTLFIIADNRIVVIKKPMYPAGAFRPPSGGISPGEPFEEGALREAYEETGLVVSLERYVLKSRVRFSNSDRIIDWTSHVFTASQVSGEIGPIDTHEIVEARYATADELMGSIRNALLDSGSTGLRYRSELADEVMGILVEAGLVEKPLKSSP